MGILVDLNRVSARLSGRTLFEDLSLTVSEGDRIGIVGVNGTGKSTLLRVIAGESNPDSGVVLRARDSRVGFLDQAPELPDGRVLDAVGDGWESRAILERVGLGAHIDRAISTLSGGQAKRVALARVLAKPIELMVLDEPTNHLDLAAVDWLEARLRDHRGGVVLVSHDRHLLDRVVNKMVELDRGHAYVHTGGYTSYLEARAQREENAVADEARRANLARRELSWLRRGAPARTRKPRSRVEAAKVVISSRKEPPARAGELELRFGTPRLGDQVISLAGVGFSYPGASTPTVRDVTIELDRRERLGIVGLNGTGKSTLLDLMAGRRIPTEGALTVGPTVVVGYYDQHGIELDPHARVRDLVAGPTRAPGSPEDIALMERFWFTGDLPFARVATLSGGERRRLQLLLVLAERPNVVLLDEPTNDLDLDTLRILEDFFEDWPGALVVASHDRTFLDRSVDRVFVVEGDGSVDPVPGGVSALVERLLCTPSTSRVSRRAVRATAETTEDRQVQRPRSMSTIGRLMHDADKSLDRLVRERDRLLIELSEEDDYLALAELGRRYEETMQRLEVAEHEWLVLAEEAEARS